MDTEAKRFRRLFLLICVIAWSSSLAWGEAVTITVGADGTMLPAAFLGLSFESSTLPPKNGNYYFDAKDVALVNTFATLGIKSLRVGANGVDDARIPVPQEPDIDSLFGFARAAGAKVIYSFRLKNGDPSVSARLAKHIAEHDADVLDSFSIGNEPNYYLSSYEAYFAQWKPHYDAILKAVPGAVFDGPSTAEKNYYALNLAKAIFPQKHLAMASDHYYWLGSGQAGAKDPPATRAKFLSSAVHKLYERDFAGIGAKLAAEGVPYRIDEMNSCFHGGAKGSSDTYASALWALDCTHWWAGHHILGMNYHTGEAVAPSGKIFAPSYSVFTHAPDGAGIDCRPIAYGLLAFSQGARGKSVDLKTEAASTFNFSAYAYRDGDGSLYITLINSSFGDHARPADVAIKLPGNAVATGSERMDLVQKASDVAAQSDISLGNASIDAQGRWAGDWQKIDAAAASGTIKLQVAPASATIVRTLAK